MAEPTKATLKRLFALSGNICAFPSCKLPMVEKSTGAVMGEICHIAARNSGGARFIPTQSENDRRAFENLLLLCRCHHKVIDTKPELYTIETLQELKSIHEDAAGRNETAEDSFFAQVLLNDFRRINVLNNSGNIAINSPNAIQAHSVTVKSSTKVAKVQPPTGTIGANSLLSRYISHLITRYNEFASSDKMRKSKFSFGAISKNIESKFGAEWRLLNEEKESEVISYLQGRISKTKQARINKGKGHRAFSTLEEYVEKHGT